MKISFAITTHNEGEYIEKLLAQLEPHIKDTNDEIVILDDDSTDTKTLEILNAAEQRGITVHTKVFEGNFADHKNYLNGLCKGDFIFQVDADEVLADYLLRSLHMILAANPASDLFLIPRVNTVNNLTDEHIKKWGWNVTEKGWINWPDYQTRLYRNIPNVKWEGKVHERIRGYKIWSALPDQEQFSLIHNKDIARQEMQNEMYSKIK